MEDLFYFLRENPFVGFILLFLLLRKIFGGGEKAKEKREELAARRAVAREQNAAKMEQARATKKARREGGLSGEGILEQIQRQIEEATQSAENSRRGQLSSSSDSLLLSRPEVRMSGPTDAENAAEKLKDTELFVEPTAAMSRGVEDSRVDYDTEDHGFAYHSPGAFDFRSVDQSQSPGAFDFRSLDQAPSDVAYYNNQRKYVSGSRIEAPTVSVAEQRTDSEPIVVKDLFSDMDALTRVFILQEVMSPPRGMRLHGAGWLRPR